jgi:hypothetical protein
LLASPAQAAPEPAKVVKDIWDSAYLDGTRAGYVHTSVVEVERDGKKVLRTTLTLHLTVKRFKDTIHMKMETGTDETPEGKVVAVSMRQTLGKDQQLVLTGAVDGKQLHVKVEGNMNLDRKVPWNDEAIGLYREMQIFKEKKVRPGDKFSYLHFEPTISAVVTVKVEVKDYEEVEIGKEKKKLLRVESVPNKIEGVQLPLTVAWLDEDMTPLTSKVDITGLGKLSLQRTTRDLALKGITPAQISDIGLTQLLPLNKRINGPHDTKEVVYLITLPEDSEPETAFARDNRQDVKNAKGKTLELHVKAVRQPPAKAPDGAKVDEEYLKSNYFINCADDKVKQHAKNAVGDETDPWKKAQRIEKWVKNNMKSTNFTEAMATADHVAKTLEGDCTEYAMLTAAMCRAVNVPSRTAIGLVYVDMKKGPVLGYHMWTEVWVRGQWLSLDATLGRGSVGAGHVKITDASWHDTQSLKPLLPVMRVMLAKPTIEVIRVEEGN